MSAETYVERARKAANDGRDGYTEQGQIYATLELAEQTRALVEEQRTANLIAFRESFGYDAALEQQVRERLGLGAFARHEQVHDRRPGLSRMILARRGGAVCRARETRRETRIGCRPTGLPWNAIVTTSPRDLTRGGSCRSRPGVTGGAS